MYLSNLCNFFTSSFMKFLTVAMIGGVYKWQGHNLSKLVNCIPVNKFLVNHFLLLGFAVVVSGASYSLKRPLCHKRKIYPRKKISAIPVFKPSKRCSKHLITFVPCKTFCCFYVTYFW